MGQKEKERNQIKDRQSQREIERKKEIKNEGRERESIETLRVREREHRDIKSNRERKIQRYKEKGR